MTQLEMDEIKRQKYRALLANLNSINSSMTTLQDNFESLEVIIEKSIKIDKDAYLSDSLSDEKKINRNIKRELAQIVIPSVKDKL